MRGEGSKPLDPDIQATLIRHLSLAGEWDTLWALRADSARAFHVTGHEAAIEHRRVLRWTRRWAIMLVPVAICLLPLPAY